MTAPGWSTPWIAGPRLVGDEILGPVYLTSGGHILRRLVCGGKRNSHTLVNRWRLVMDGDLQRTHRQQRNEFSDDFMLMCPHAPALTDEEPQERKRRLEAAGLGHLYDTTLGSGPSGWLIYPDSMDPNSRQKGILFSTNIRLFPKGKPRSTHERSRQDTLQIVERPGSTRTFKDYRFSDMGPFPTEALNCPMVQDSNSFTAASFTSRCARFTCSVPPTAVRAGRHQKYPPIPNSP